MESKQGRTISISMLLLSLAIFSLDPAYANGDSVSWEDLAEHLAEKEIPLVQLNLRDCPDNMQDVEPDRVVSQVIENTYYLWEEYDITEDADVYMCIVMRKPNPGPLTAQEAQVLLTGSQLWEVELPAHIELPGEEFVVTGLVDDRRRIHNTTDFPWNTYCYLAHTFPPEKVSKPYKRGTGCLVTPYMVLTCAHNIYHFDTGSYIEQMTVTPGQTQQDEWDLPEEPYDSQEIVDYKIAPEFTDSNSVAYDYGAVFLDTPFSGINTYMPLEFSSSLSTGDIVEIAGYPKYVHDEAYSLALWDANGPISTLYSNALLYKTDTSGGDSGAPIRKRNSNDDPYRIIGIHTGGNEAEAFNAGPRLGAHNQALICKWMEWTPGGEETTIIFEDTFPAPMINTDKWVAAGATVDYVGIGEPSSPYSLRLNGHPSGGDSVESTFIDLSSYSQVTLTYWYQRTGGGESPDDVDHLIVEYYNGFSWVELDRQLGSGPNMTTFEKSRPIELPDGARHAGFKLRIRSIGSESTSDVYDDWFVDDVKLVSGPRGVKLKGGGIFLIDPIAPPFAYQYPYYSSDGFGGSVSISGDYAMVTREITRTAYYGPNIEEEDWVPRPFQVVSVYRREGSSWTSQGEMRLSGAISISGEYAAIGTNILKRNGTNWTQQKELNIPAVGASDVSIDQDHVIVGVMNDDPKGTNSGSAYIFKRNGSNWIRQNKLIASDGKANDHFGFSVAINGDFAFVGGHFHIYDWDWGLWEASDSVVYVFKRNGTDWRQHQKLTASDDWFGVKVSISGYYAIVKARDSAYIFELSGTRWALNKKLAVLDASSGGLSDVAISDNHAVVSYAGDDADSGFVCLYRRVGADWILEEKIVPTDKFDTFISPEPKVYNCYSVSISGCYLIIGGTVSYRDVWDAYIPEDDLWLSSSWGFAQIYRF